MKANNPWWLGGMAGVALMAPVLFTGCVTGDRDARVNFTNATINSETAHLILDTGSDETRLLNTGAKRIGVAIATPAHQSGMTDLSLITALSEPTRIVVNGTAFTSALQIVDPPWYMTMSKIDGLVSWREVRDNILIFDPTHRTVAAVEKLPDETAGWLKLGISGDDILYLETTLTNGKTGIIELDTGNASGVTLSPAQWTEWRKAHPKAQVVTEGIAEIAGAGLTKEGWADEIKLGELRLTDVPVHMATRAEMKDMPGNYAGTLGLYAVARMKLVLDGKHRAAYIQPEPPPGPYYAKFNRPGIKPDAVSPNTGQGNWAVSETVKIDSQSVLAEAAIGAGLMKAAKKDYAGSIADFSGALGITPNDTGSRLFRADAEMTKGDYAAAEEDCGRVLELNPKNITALGVRCVIRLRQADYDGAIADSARLMDICGETEAVYLYRSRAELGKADYPAAIADCDGAWKLNTNNVGALVDRGECKMEQGNFDGGIADLNQALKLNPHSAQAWHDRGMAKLGRDDFTGGIADLDRTVELDAKNPTVLADLGMAKLTRGDLAGAEVDLGRAVKMDAGSSYVQMMRGTAWEIRGDFNEAAACYDKAIKLQPEASPNSRLHRQLLRRRLGLPAEDFSSVINGWKESWFKTEGRFVAGQTTEPEFLASAHSDSPRQQCEACYYAGMMRLLSGDKTGARELWAKCLATEFRSSREYYFARAEIARLDGSAPK